MYGKSEKERERERLGERERPFQVGTAVVRDPPGAGCGHTLHRLPEALCTPEGREEQEAYRKGVA